MDTFSCASSGHHPNPLWYDVDWSAGIDVPPGSHLTTSRNGFVHHGIFLGDHQVIHYAGMCAGFETGPIEIITLSRFANGRQIRVRRHMQASFEPEQVLKRALSRLGENRYRLLTNNCEHFCHWCLFGKSESQQVRQVLSHPLMALQLIALYWPLLIAVYLPVVRRSF